MSSQDAESPQQKFFTSARMIKALDFHPTQPWLLTGSNSIKGNVAIYNIESGKEIHSFRPSIPVVRVKFIARKNWYVVGLTNGHLHIFNCTTHEELTNFRAHGSYNCSLAIHPTASIVLTGCQGNTIKAWDWDKQWKNIHTYRGHINLIRSIVINPKDPNTFASVCHDGAVRMWSITSSTPQFTMQAHNQAVTHVDFYPGVDKPYLLTTSDDNTVKIWDYLSQTLVQTIEGHAEGVFSAVFHPSLPIIISGSKDGTVKIWNSLSYRLERTLSYNFGWVICIALRQGTSEVAVGFHQAVVTLELAHSEPYQMAITRGDMSGEHSVHKFSEGRQIEHAQSLDSLTTTYDTVLSLSPPFTTPYQQCITLARELITTKATNKLISELRNDKAQVMVDFLSKMVTGENIFPQHSRKYILYLLSKLAKSAQVFPQSLELEGVQCKLTDPVAAGGYGFIYKGKHEESIICIKAVRVDSRGVNKQKLRAHAGELIIWAHLSHPNVLPFLGIYPSKEEVSRVCIVSPWMHNGDLLEYLNMVSDVPRKPLVRDIVSGLQYLHDLDIIHADLKAKNVLVSENGRAMLADFGISRLSVTMTMTSTNVSTGTAYWMAPELHLDDEPQPSRETDIWAFGCTCYEIITGMAPFIQYRHPVMLMGAFMRGKIIPVKPEERGIGWDEDVWSVAMRCWQRDPASRPRAHELFEMINSFDFLDDRRSNSEYERSSRSSPEIDYTHILGILEEIRHSVAV